MDDLRTVLRRWTALTLILVGAGSCATSSGETSADEAETTEPAKSAPEYVVVPSSVDFATRPVDDAETWRHRAGGRWRFEVVSTEGDWLELKAAGDGTGAAPMLKQIDLTVWVKRAQTEPASDEPKETAAPETPPQSYQLTWVAPGSTLYWPGGAKAGEVRDAKWPVRLELDERDGRRCFAVNLHESAPKSYDPDRYVPICIDAADLTEGADAQAETGSADTSDMEVGMMNIAVDIRMKAVRGGLSWEGVKKPVVDNQGAVKNCYSEAVSTDDPFGGRLAVTVHATPDGEVESVEVGESTLPGDTVSSCVREALGWMEVPSGGKKGELDLEFVFSTGTE